jgi:hypothetical protein
MSQLAGFRDTRTQKNLQNGGIACICSNGPFTIAQINAHVLMVGNHNKTIDQLDFAG